MLIDSSPPDLKTTRLKLKAVTEQDIPAYTKNFVDYEVIRHLSSVVPWPYPDNGVREFFLTTIVPNQGKNRWVWGIFRDKNPDELIGVVDLWRPGTPDNRGFWLGRKYWGNGYMTEAVRAVTDFAFDVLEFKSLVFSNARGNDRSARIKEKTGARLVRVEPAAFVDPLYTEQEIWELSRDQWIAVYA